MPPKRKYTPRGIMQRPTLPRPTFTGPREQKQAPLGPAVGTPAPPGAKPPPFNPTPPGQALPRPRGLMQRPPGPPSHAPAYGYRRKRKPTFGAQTNF